MPTLASLLQVDLLCIHRSHVTATVLSTLLNLRALSKRGELSVLDTMISQILHRERSREVALRGWAGLPAEMKFGNNALRMHIAYHSVAMCERMQRLLRIPTLPLWFGQNLATTCDRTLEPRGSLLALTARSLSYGKVQLDSITVFKPCLLSRAYPPPVAPPR